MFDHLSIYVISGRHLVFLFNVTAVCISSKQCGDVESNSPT